MEKHEPTQCPRCETIFTCKINSVFKCDCMDMELTPVELQYIKENTESGTCLCFACLLDMKKEFHQQEQHQL